MSNEEAIATACLQREALMLECRILLIEVANCPNCLKLLTGVRDQLRMFAAYKVNRRRG